MTPSNTIDIVAVETRARALRAAYFREMIAALGTALRNRTGRAIRA
ncbi:MAG: hypothetical protein AAF264_11405 [Pseudomonadota bacterium]